MLETVTEQDGVSSVTVYFMESIAVAVHLTELIGIWLQIVKVYLIISE